MSVRISGALTIVVAASIAAPSGLLAQASPSAFKKAYRFDVAGRETGMILPDPDGSGPIRFGATRKSYDSFGNMTKLETGELNAWQSDSVSPINWVGFTIEETIDYTYDNDGNPTTKVRSSGGNVLGVEHRSYDAYGQPMCVAVRMNPATWLSYTDACTHQPAVQATDQITKTTYNAVGQLLKVQHGFGTTLQRDYATFTYNNPDQLLNFDDPDTITDAKGNIAKFEYGGSAYGKRTKWIFPSKTTPGALDSGNYEENTYEANGNLKTARKRDGRTITFNYDGLDQVISKLVPDNCAPIQLGACTPSTATRDVYYAYDLAGHQVSARFDSASGEGVVNQFNGFGELIASTVTMGGVSRQIQRRHDPNGNVDRLTHPDLVEFASSFDGLDRLETATWTKSGATVPFVGITYDSGGRRWKMKRGNSWTEYGYDGLSRLTSLCQKFAGGTCGVTQALTSNQTYAYDYASRLVTETRDNDDYRWNGAITVIRSYVANGLNQYSSVSSVPFTYDANGNLIADGTWTFTYDAENRLVSAVTSGVSAGLTYDPLGRLWKLAGSGIGDVQFVYDGDQLAAEYGSTGSMVRRYYFGPNADEPILDDQGGALACTGATKFLHANHQGSIVALADCSGNRTNVNSYDEYGIPGLNNTGRFQFTGQMFLYELGLYYYKARIYSPTLGRFLQVDPVGYDDHNNLYAYVANDPVGHIDPSGNGKIKYFVETAKGFWKRIGEKQAQSSRKAGKNVSAEGPGQVKRGKRLEEKVQGSKAGVKKDGPHPNGDPRHKGTTETHFQAADRKKAEGNAANGHTFVGPPAPGGAAAGGAAAGLVGAMRDIADAIGTAEDQLDENSTPQDKTRAEVWDFFDPASNIAEGLRDVADLIDPPR